MEDGYFRWKKPIYWRANRTAYTDDLHKAGRFTGQEVEEFAGCKGDWVLEPVTSDERFGDIEDEIFTELGEGECPCYQIPISPYAKKRKTKLSILIREACFCGRF
tara:strand:- start:997 stop:1311 length:315 start_codon:yes stop_codon:yes gene_type:complete